MSLAQIIKSLQSHVEKQHFYFKPLGRSGQHRVWVYPHLEGDFEATRDAINKNLVYLEFEGDIIGIRNADIREPYFRGYIPKFRKVVESTSELAHQLIAEARAGTYALTISEKGKITAKADENLHAELDVIRNIFGQPSREFFQIG